MARSGLCLDHAREADAARGTTTQRGYGAEHQERRRALLPSSWYTACPRCDVVMLPSERLELDHSTPLYVDAGGVGDRIVHARCNPRGQHEDARRIH